MELQLAQRISKCAAKVDECKSVVEGIYLGADLPEGFANDLAVW